MPSSAQRPIGNELLALLAKLARTRSGVTAIEYAFIAGLVALVIVAAVSTLGTSVSSLFGSVIGGF
jgi:pilus assembly protein Flp/PilA